MTSSFPGESAKITTELVGVICWVDWEAMVGDDDGDHFYQESDTN